MKKYEVLNQIIEGGIIAVIRAESAEMAQNIANACILGGINAIEVTFTLSGAETLIKTLKGKFRGKVIGAGTVLDANTARIAILNGADFIVGPNFDLDIAKICNLYQIPYMPGCQTATEIVKAMKAGADIIKVFPGSAFGPSYIKALKGPLPQANLMPTGGVDLDNVESWIEMGSIVVGVGSKLTSPSKQNDFAKITSIAKEFVEKIKLARKKQKNTR